MSKSCGCGCHIDCDICKTEINIERRRVRQEQAILNKERIKRELESQKQGLMWGLPRGRDRPSLRWTPLDNVDQQFSYAVSQTSKDRPVTINGNENSE
ncbi:hypothetical protein HK096_011254, partial [Nowakowskiella sp. JEL0078]